MIRNSYRLLLVASMFILCSLSLSAQYISSGAGFGYAIHSKLPMYSFHGELGYKFEESPWTIKLNIQIGLAEGNRNFEFDESKPMMLYAENYFNPLDNFGGYLITPEVYKELSIKTSHTQQSSITISADYKWLNRNRWSFASGFGFFGARVYKTYIINEVEGIQQSVFYGTSHVIYPEPYYYNFLAGNVYIDSSVRFQVSERIHLNATTFYQHMRGFNGLASLYLGFGLNL